jgi:hypothetical protein
MNKSSVFLALLVLSFMASAEVVTACDVGSGPTMRVEVIREAPIADTHVYLLRQNGEATPIFSDVDSSRGASVRAACVGRKNRALVLSGEFAANAVQGFVLTYDPADRKVGRLDFAEKSRPKWLFLSKTETIVVIPTHGLGETSKRFVAYRHATGSSDAPAGEGIDQLPKAEGYEKVDVDVYQAFKDDGP